MHYTRHTDNDNPRLGGLRSPRLWFLLIALPLALAVLFQLDYQRMGILTVVGVLVLIGGGLISSGSEEPTRKRRPLSKARMLRAKSGSGSK